MGWAPADGNKWSHSEEGLLDSKDLVLHKIRMSWRRARWEAFQNKNRRDNRILTEVPFDPVRHKLATKVFQSADNHVNVRAVMTGVAKPTHGPSVM